MCCFSIYAINKSTKPFNQEKHTMDNKKFEQLIDLIINENEEQARALFHDIVVEKSREIYESMMDEEMHGMDEGMGGQVGDLLDEINVEEEGMTEEEDLDFDSEEDEVVDIEAGEDDEGGEEDLEDRVVDLEDKLDQLMAEFEEIMGADDAEVDGEEDFEAGEEEGEEEGEAMMEEEDLDEAADDEEDGLEESVMEAVQLKQIGGQTYDKYGKMGDNGVQTKSPSLQNSGQAGMDSKPVKFSGAAESVPTSPKAAHNAYTKGETQVKHAGQFKNAPAQAGQDLEKAPAPTKSQASGVNTKSPVAESKKTVKRIVK